MKLKTLNDIKVHRKSTMGKCFTEAQLKQEAIKHIKYLQDYLDTHSFGTVNQYRTVEHQAGYNAQIVWIKEFFNIEEKDLK